MTAATFRPAQESDTAAIVRVRVDSFGPEAATWSNSPASHRQRWVAEVAGEVVAVSSVRQHTTWFHGAPVATAGIGGVATLPELRSTGIASGLIAASLEHSSAAVSTLFPSAIGVYTSLGYEPIATLDVVRLELAELTAVAPPSDATFARRASFGDFPAIAALYDRWAREQNGTFTRRESHFTSGAESLFSSDPLTTTVAVRPTPNGTQEICGYVVWERTDPGESLAGHLPNPTLAVQEFIAVTDNAARALWRLLAAHRSTSSALTWRTSGFGTASDVPNRVLPVHSRSHLIGDNLYALAIRDLPAACAAAQIAPGLATIIEFAVTGATNRVAGRWRLTAGGGRVQVSAHTPRDESRAGDQLTLHPRALAASYAGAATLANLRLAGLVTGSTDHDRDWDALWRGREVHVRDEF